MTVHITQHRAGFPAGLTRVTGMDDTVDPTGIEFAVLRLADGEAHQEDTPGETAYLLMAGTATVTLGNQVVDMTRSSLFDESPSCVHLSAGSRIKIAAHGSCEFTIYRTANHAAFAARVFTPADTKDEHRGKGQAGGACLRLVRTIFDRSNSDANAELVLGEVITLPGRWSSYPPHHHPQPEIYHYRFDHPQGFGHAEHGDRVFKIRHNDAVKILAGNDHAQCAAPGYAMYYAWVIRHLPDNPYIVPEFTTEHRWMMDAAATIWRPKGLTDA